MLKYIAYLLVVLAIVTLSVGFVKMRNQNIIQVKAFEEELDDFQRDQNKNRAKIAELYSDLDAERNRTNELSKKNASLIKSLEKIAEINNNLEVTKEENEALNQKNTELEEEIQNLRTTKGNGIKATTLGCSAPSSGKGRLLGSFEVTAYTDNVASQGAWVGQTASGMKPGVGVVAVDPKVIPLHTRMYVEGYGECVAGDTGGAIKGNRVDVFFNTASECYTWGRKQAKVYILD